jgi:hypothetical protein
MLGHVPLTGTAMAAMWDRADELAEEKETNAKSSADTASAKRLVAYNAVVALNKADKDLKSPELLALIAYKLSGKGISKFSTRAKRLAEWKRLKAI